MSFVCPALCGLRVLLVVPDERDREFLGWYLAESGAEVVEVKSNATALDAIGLLEVDLLLVANDAIDASSLVALVSEHRTLAAGRNRRALAVTLTSGDDTCSPPAEGFDLHLSSRNVPVMVGRLNGLAAQTAAPIALGASTAVTARARAHRQWSR